MTPDAPSDPPRRHFTVRGVRCAFTEEGRGPPIVAVHGLPGSARDFRWLGPALGDRARLIRLDLPGFGETPIEAARSYGVVDRGAFVLEALDALGLRGAILLGHSMGGPVAVAAAAAAAQDGDRIAGVGLVASPGLRAHRAYRHWNVARLAGWLRVRPVRWALLPLVHRGFRAAGFPKSVTYDEVIHTCECGAAVRFDEHAERIESLRALPFLIAFAEDDPLLEKEIGEELARVCGPGPRLQWPTGGHNVQKTRAIELADALVAWAAEIRAGGA